MSYEPRLGAQDMGVGGEATPVEIEIDRLSAGGRGVGRHEGQIWFVRGAVPGDRVLAHALCFRARFVEASTLRLIRASRSRRPAPCPVQDRCGGCPWMVLEEGAQREWKRELVRDALQRIGKISEIEVEPVAGVGSSLGYRNKTEMLLGLDPDGRPAIGYHGTGGKSGAVDVAACAVQRDSANVALAAARRILLDSRSPWLKTVFRVEEPFRLVIRSSSKDGAVLVAVRETRRRFPSLRAFARRLTRDCAAVRGVVRLMARPGRRGGTRVEAIHGPDWVEERIGELTLRLPASSFLQVNTEVATALVRLVTEIAAPDGSTQAMDLYGGVGTIGLHLALRGAAVTVCEADRAAVACGLSTSQAQGLDRVRFVHSDVRSFLESGAGPGAPDELIVANPPRGGFGRGVAEAILCRRPGKLILVSCDPPTLARDLRVLVQGGLRVTRVSPLDMFPQTSHVETVAVLAP